MPVHDNLGKRMKEYYEQIPKTKLMRRCPVICRIDGKAFHSFTRGFKKPFDEVLIKSMQETMKYLCENIQGCVLGYHQSDEISLLLIDYRTLDSQAFFDYEIQKICSITASIATMAFNKFFQNNLLDIDPLVTFYDGEDPSEFDLAEKFGFDAKTPEGMSELKKYCEKYYKAIDKGAMFDARCFNIPKEECTNYFYWRQLDATRNSIQMVGQANFSHKELQNKSCNEIQDMLHEQKGINWNDFPTHQKRGSCCIKINELKDGLTKKLGDGSEVYYEGDIIRRKWIIDNEIPIFVNEGRGYIEQRF
jgi:tRNA(His) 5'-end guanylyltransferase